MLKRILTFVGITLALSFQILNAQPVLEEPIHGETGGDRLSNNTEIAVPNPVRNTFTKGTNSDITSTLTKNEQIKLINIYGENGNLIISFNESNLEAYNDFIKYTKMRELYKVEIITDQRQWIQKL